MARKIHGMLILPVQHQSTLRGERGGEILDYVRTVVSIEILSSADPVPSTAEGIISIATGEEFIPLAPL